MESDYIPAVDVNRFHYHDMHRIRGPIVHVLTATSQILPQTTFLCFCLGALICRSKRTTDGVTPSDAEIEKLTGKPLSAEAGESSAAQGGEGVPMTSAAAMLGDTADQRKMGRPPKSKKQEEEEDTSAQKFQMSTEEYQQLTHQFTINNDAIKVHLNHLRYVATTFQQTIRMMHTIRLQRAAARQPAGHVQVGAADFRGFCKRPHRIHAGSPIFLSRSRSSGQFVLTFIKFRIDLNSNHYWSLFVCFCTSQIGVVPSECRISKEEFLQNIVPLLGKPDPIPGFPGLHLIGGLHSTTAMKRCLSLRPEEECFHTRRCIVLYGVPKELTTKVSI